MLLKPSLERASLAQLLLPKKTALVLIKDGTFEVKDALHASINGEGSQKDRCQAVK